MVVVLDNAVATSQVTGVLQVGAGPTTISVVNLGVLNTNSTGPVPLTANTQTFSIQQPDGNNDQLLVGESFTVVRTVTNTITGAVVGVPTSTSYTLIGSGSVTPLLGTPRDVILAEDSSGNQFFIYPDNNAPGLLGVVTLTYDIDRVGYDFTLDAPLCFTRGTMLDTPDGPRAIEDLAMGDLVITRDNGPQPVRWIGSRRITARQLDQWDNLRPIVIRAGALGDNVPATDLVVSPQHRILVRSKIAQKMFGTMEVLVAAKQLLQIDGVDVHETGDDGIEYFHMLFERHEVVYANGAEAESLFTGPEALKTVGAAALEEIYQIFPELMDASYEPIGARFLVPGRHGRKLASRHAQHGKSLVS